MKKRIFTRFYYGLIWGFLSCLVLGCNSVKKLAEKGNPDLAIMIIDEQGNPVKDFCITLEKETMTVQEYTDKQGVCVFYSLVPQDYSFKGTKENYLELNGIIRRQDLNEGLLCWKTQSAGAVLEKVYDEYEAELYAQGLSLLDKLCCSKNTGVTASIHLFRAYGLYKLGNREDTRYELNILKEVAPDSFDPAISALENGIKGESVQ